MQHTVLSNAAGEMRSSLAGEDLNEVFKCICGLINCLNDEIKRMASAALHCDQSTINDSIDHIVNSGISELDLKLPEGFDDDELSTLFESARKQINGILTFIRDQKDQWPHEDEDADTECASAP